MFGRGGGPKKPKFGGGKPAKKEPAAPGGGRAGAAERGEIARRLGNVDEYLQMFKAGNNLPAAALALGELSQIKMINKPEAVRRLPEIIRGLVVARGELQRRGNLPEMLKADEILIDACRLAESNDPLRNLATDYGLRAKTAIDARAKELWENASNDLFKMMNLVTEQHTVQLMKRFTSAAQEAAQRAVMPKLIAQQFELIKQDYIALAQYGPALRRT